MGENGGEFDKLPEECVSQVLSLTTPRDSCRLAVLSTAFRSAADFDTVWERFLPPDHKEILDRTVEIVRWSSKRDLYFQLCNPILIDGGKKSFHLEKSSGAKCYMISSRELTIVRGDIPQYWMWSPVAALGFVARFPEMACLLNVSWLEIHGKMKIRTLSPSTCYTAYLVFKLDPLACGFSDTVQEASVKVGSQESRHNVCLQPPGAPRSRHGIWTMQPRQDAGDLDGSRAPSRRADGWMEIELGDFFSGHGGGDDDDEADICLMEDNYELQKNGLFVLGMEFRPKK